MKNIWIIAKREFSSFFNSLTAYIMLILFLGISGLFTWFIGRDIFFIKEASLQVFFSIAYWTLFFFIPAITMRLIAEEKKSGTIELLLTKPVSDWQVVLGKFSATLGLVIVALLLTLPYYITVSLVGPIDHGATITAYLGLILMSAAYISIGLFASSLTSNQIIGFLLALTIGIFFQILFSIFSGLMSGFFSELFHYLNLSTHFESISRGVLDSRNIIFFLSIVFTGMVLTEANLAKSRL
jgi:ABC-2 type transport system permease protein